LPRVRLNKSICNLTYLLFETALFTSGFALNEPMSFTKHGHHLASMFDDDDEVVALTAAVKESPALARSAWTLMMKEN